MKTPLKCIRLTGILFLVEFLSSSVSDAANSQRGAKGDILDGFFCKDKGKQP